MLAAQGGLAGPHEALHPQCLDFTALQSACQHDDPEVCAPAGNALAAQGGFCAGPREMVDHQRLSGMGYCFSASLPPYLAVAASTALQALARKPQLVRRLQLNAASLRDALQDVPGALGRVGSNNDVLLKQQPGRPGRQLVWCPQLHAASLTVPHSSSLW